MEGLFLGICYFFKSTLNVSILMLAVAECVFFVLSFRFLKDARKKIEKVAGTTEVARRVRNREKKLFERQVVTYSEVDWERYDEFLKGYQSKNWMYTVYALIIQLFTLLGILGTVAGLYISLNSNQDLASAGNLYDGVRLALSSTILGIMFAVIAKIGDIVLQSAFIDYIEGEIERFESNYQVDRDLPISREE